MTSRNQTTVLSGFIIKMIQTLFCRSALLVLIVFNASRCAGQNTPCPLCKDGSYIINPDTVVSIPAGYVDIDQATCNQIQTVSMSGALDASTCSILNSGVFKEDCLCSEPVTSLPTKNPTTAPVTISSTIPTQQPFSFPTSAPKYVYQVTTPLAPTPVAYQTLAPKADTYQSPASQTPVQTIKYQTLAPRAYVYPVPTAPTPASYTQQTSASAKPVAYQTLAPRASYQTLAPRSSSYPATSETNTSSAPASETRANSSRAPVLSPQSLAPKLSSAPALVPAAIPLQIFFNTRRPTPIIEFDYSVCSICGADRRVANKTKVVTSPPGYFIAKASCYQLERVGLMGLMNSINCKLATLLIGEPKCGCVPKEKSSDKPVPIPVNTTVCHVCGKGYVVGKPSNKIQRKLGFFVGSASCGQVAELGLIGLIPTGLCSITKQDVKSNCGCVRATSHPTYLASDYPSQAPSSLPSQTPTTEKERGKKTDHDGPEDEDDDEPKHEDDDEPKDEDDDDEPKL
jgi:hypothetical protein